MDISAYNACDSHGLAQSIIQQLNRAHIIDVHFKLYRFFFTFRITIESIIQSNCFVCKYDIYSAATNTPWFPKNWHFWCILQTNSSKSSHQSTTGIQSTWLHFVDLKNNQRFNPHIKRPIWVLYTNKNAISYQRFILKSSAFHWASLF